MAESNSSVKSIAVSNGPSRSDRAVIKVRLSGVEARNRLTEAARSEAGSARLRATIEELLQPPSRSSDRDGLLQPQIPARLKDALQSAAKYSGAGSVTALIRADMAKLIDFESGKRRKLPDGRYRQPANLRVFKLFAIQLAQKNQGLVRLQFNAGPAAEAVKNLINDVGLTQSQFFTGIALRVRDNKRLRESVSDPGTTPDAGGADSD